MPARKYAMILAAGRGERLRPLTDSTPKPLLTAGTSSLIEHHLHKLSDAGYSDIVINIGHLGQQIIDSLGDGSCYRLNIHYSDERDEVLETGGGIFKALPLLKSEEFLVINGDIWTDFNFAVLPEKIKGSAHLVLVENPPHHPQGDFSLQKDFLIEKENSLPSWTYSGIGIYSHTLFDGCAEERFPLAPLLKQHIAGNRVTGEIFTGKWFDIGTRQRLEELNKMIDGAE